MNRQLQLVGTLLRKDFRLFWRFAALNALLIVVWQFPPVIRQLGGFGPLAQVAIVLATILLILAVFHEDAMVSLNHDWLTRPISGLALLLAKCAFVVLAIVAPTVLGAIAYNLYQGRSVGESMLTGLAAGAGGSAIFLDLLVMAVAAVTANMRQAIIVVLAGIASLIALTVLSARIFGVGNSPGLAGSEWVVGRTLQIMACLVAVAILLVQYAYRHTKAGRVIAGVAVVTGWGFVLLMTAPRVFAVEKFLSPDPADAASVRIELVKGCFPARVLSDNRTAIPVTATAPGADGEDESGHVGPRALTFSTQNILTGIPVGDRLTMGRMQITYRVAGEVIESLKPEFPAMQTRGNGGLLATSQNWMLSRRTYDRLAKSQDVQTEIHYFLTLLAPAASAEFLADGRRQFYPGLGYCGATLGRTSAVVTVDCFKSGTQPAQLVAGLASAPGSADSPSGSPDFTPPALDFWGGRPHLIRLHAEGNGIPQVNLTAFTAIAHFERQIVVPGILGGPVSACPAP
jgi:hypothetical protein